MKDYNNLFEETFSKRYVLATMAGGVSAALAGCTDFGSDGGISMGDEQTDGDETTYSETVTVAEGESISEAIESVEEGGQLELSGSTYLQSFTIDKPLTITGNSATFDGSDVDTDGPAVEIDAPEVSVENITFRDFDTVFGRPEDGSDAADITLSNVTIQDSSVGLTGEYELVDLIDVVAQDIDSAAFQFELGSEGVSYLSDVICERCDRGLVIEGGETIDANNLEIVESAEVGLLIEAGTAEYQTITIEHSEITDCGEDGISVDGNTDPDNTCTIRNCSLLDNDGGAADVTSEDITIEDCDAADNGPVTSDIGLTTSGDGEVTVRGTSIERTERDTSGFGSSSQGRGLVIEDAATVTIDDVELISNGGNAIRIDADSARGQTVDISDSFLSENDNGSAIYFPATGGTDELTITDTDIENTSGAAVNTSADIVELSRVTAEDIGSANAAFDISSPPDGEVTITDCTIERTERNTGFSSDDDGYGILIEDGDDITIRDVDVFDTGGSPFALLTEDARGRSVTIEDCFLSDNESGSGIIVQDTSGEDTVDIDSVQIEGMSNRGLNIESDMVDINNALIEDNGSADAGIEVTSSSDGDVAITDSTVLRTTRSSGFGSNDGGRGIWITDGEVVTIDDTVARNNDGENIEIETDSVRGQTVTLDNVTAEESSNRHGILIRGSNGDDTITVRNSAATDNDGYGYRLGSESVTVADSTASGNTDGGLELLDIERSEATITNSDL